MLIPYRRGKKWGYASFSKEIIIECIYERAEPFFDDRAVVQRNGKWGVIDKNGTALTPFKYDDIDDYVNGYASVKFGNKWGFVDINGKECVPVKYDFVQNFSESRAAVKLNNKISFIDESGNPITEFIYDNCMNFENGYASVEKDSKHGCINLKGIEVIKCIYDIPVILSEGLAAASFVNNSADLNQSAAPEKYSPGMLTGYQKGNKIIWKDRYGDIYDADNFKLSAKNQRCGYLNEDGEIVIPFKFEMAFPFKEGLACVVEQNKCGFINQKGEWVIENIYDSSRDFSEGLAAVRKEGKWGYIDKEGKIIIDFLYKKANDFTYGRAMVEIDNNQYGFIDCNGNEINLGGMLIEGDFEKYTYFEHETFSEGLIATAFIWSDIFYINEKGKPLNSLREYLEAKPFKNGIAEVKIRSNDEVESGYIDFEGKHYWED
jgi:hypothetical protein